MCSWKTLKIIGGLVHFFSRVPFRLQTIFDFDEVLPGSAYSWTIIATSQGLNPLLRTYSFSDVTLPTHPISPVQAAYTLESYNTFVFTVGDQPFVINLLAVLSINKQQGGSLMCVST